MSEKSLRNQANHGFLAWAEDPRGRKGALPLERMRKRWRAGHSGVYSFVAGQAKWKSRLTTVCPSNHSDTCLYAIDRKAAPHVPSMFPFDSFWTDPKTLLRVSSESCPAASLEPVPMLSLHSDTLRFVVNSGCEPICWRRGGQYEFLIRNSVGSRICFFHGSAAPGTAFMALSKSSKEHLPIS